MTPSKRMTATVGSAGRNRPKGRYFSKERNISTHRMKRRAVAQDRLGRLGITSVGLMQDQAGHQAHRRGAALAAVNDDAPGRLADPRPQRKYHDIAGASAQQSEKGREPIDAVNERDAAAIARHAEREIDPRREI